MTKTKEEIAFEYNEIQDIREDLNSLKNNVVELTRHLTQDGKERLVDMEDRAVKAYKSQYAELEKSVRAEPGKAIAIAFGAGLVASLLLHRR